ncbi:helix-turn-helix transcriptional regulator [Saccharopolyspora elongata]|uniref:helix-turn-helix transcriptional regulator n=1 Tax=Saccharopolyspora elongata TaxID=2530387 RepID=UPI001404E095|nr:AraC family transcriptional regulator [Saccharopolyspora elongata]
MTRRIDDAIGTGRAELAQTEPTSAATSWHTAVERAVQQMRENLADPQYLADHARAGLFSPFHFHRVFRNVTAATPGRFLAALRIAEAQRLLIRSPLRVTDIAARVGYSSLSTFTTQFARLVGLSPRQFRAMAIEFGDRPLAALAARAPAAPSGHDAVPVVVDGADDGILFVGLFHHGIPQGAPVSCAVRPTPGPVRLRRPRDGEYHVLAVCFDPDVRIAESLDHRHDCRVVAVGSMTVPGGRACHLRLRRPRPTDPPVVLALPLLG